MPAEKQYGTKICAMMQKKRCGRYQGAAANTYSGEFCSSPLCLCHGKNKPPAMHNIINLRESALRWADSFIYDKI